MNMKTLNYLVAGLAAVVMICACGRNPQKNVSDKTDPKEVLQDTCVVFSADSCSTFGEWMSKHLSVTKEMFSKSRGTGVTLSFDVAPDGSLDSIIMSKKVDGKELIFVRNDSSLCQLTTFEESLLKTVRSCPRWSPAVVGGQRVGSSINMYVRAGMVNDSLMVAIPALYRSGKDNDFSTWFTGNLIYPEAAKKEGAEGQVSLRFTVGKDGSLSDIQVQKSNRQDFTEEALRVMALSGHYDPCYVNGKATPVTYFFPVIFKQR
jgi:TonB family protein